MSVANVIIAILLFDLVRSSFLVAAQAFHFGHTMRNAVLRVDLRTRSDLYLTLVKRNIEGDAFFPPFEHMFEPEYDVVRATPDFEVRHYRRIFE